MSDEPAPLPCPFCGGPARTYYYNGTTQAVCCAAKYVDCAGTTCDAPVAMWNRRVAPMTTDLETAARAALVDAIAKLHAQDRIGDGDYPAGFTIYASLGGDGQNFFWHESRYLAETILAAIEPAIRADERKRSEAKVERLRGLLRGLRDWLADEKLNTWPYMEGPGFYDDKETWVHCLNTSL